MPAIDVSGVRDRKLDLFLGHLPPLAGTAMADLSIEYLFHDRLVIAAGRRNRWARRSKIDLAELVDEPSICLRRSRGTIGDWQKRSSSEA